jgi:hypothetical protein
MHLIVMNKKRSRLFGVLILLGALTATHLFGQRPQDQTGEENAYGSRFFDQLRTIFGMFRDSDLQRVFQDAQPIQCTELLGRKGQWRPVAFFNEDRSLGDWCREDLAEVKSDLSVFTFLGDCEGPGRVQVGSEFPTTASFEEYRQRRIELNQIDVTVNDPVKAVVSSRTMAYTFDLPYLFKTPQGKRDVYSLAAPDSLAAYAPDVSSRWECKAVSSKDVTYRFLICRVSTVPQRPLQRNQKWEPVFGSSAFFILSDGTEAKSSVNLTFGNETSSDEKPANAVPASDSHPRPTLKRK